MRKEITNRDRVRVATLFCCIFMFAYSVSGMMYSTLAPFVIEHYGTTLTQSSLFTISSSVGNLLVNLLIIQMADRFDKAKLLAVLALVLSGALLYIGTAPVMSVYLIVNCISGMVSPWMDNTCTAYISDLYGEQRGRYIGIIYTLFAVGSACAPTFNTVILETLGLTWNWSYRVMGFVMLAAAVAYCLTLVTVKRPAVLVSGDAAQLAEKKKLSVKEMLGNRNMVALILSGVTLAFYQYYSSMLPTFFSFTDPETYTTTLRNFIVTCGSVGYMISRFLYVPLAPKLDPIKYLRFQALFCTACDFIALLVNEPIVWMILMFCQGLISGSSYTMTIILTCNEYPDYSSSANAATAFASGIAYLIATPIMNWVADNVSFFVAMMVPVVCELATYFIYRFIYVAQPKKAEGDSAAQ